MIKFDKVTCLCLDKRQPLWTELSAQCKAIGWNMIPFIAGEGNLLEEEHYDYFDNENVPTREQLNMWGYGKLGYKHHHWHAFHCHQTMLARAKREGCKTVLFLEDDAYITARAINVLEKLEKEINETPWDVLYLGWWIGDNGELPWVEHAYNERGATALARVNFNVGGLHGVVIRNTVFDIIGGLRPVNPIDYQLNQYGFHKAFKSYYVEPKILGMKSTYSYCEGSVINRPEL